MKGTRMRKAAIVTAVLGYSAFVYFVISYTEHTHPVLYWVTFSVVVGSGLLSGIQLIRNRLSNK